MAGVHLPLAPTFHPTADEFADPCAYITKISAVASTYGICKVVPPPGWCPPSTEPSRLVSPVMYKTRLQRLHTLQAGKPFPDGEEFTYSDYQDMAEAFKQTKFSHLIPPATDWQEFMAAHATALAASCRAASHGAPAATTADGVKVDAAALKEAMQEALRTRRVPMGIMTGGGDPTRQRVPIPPANTLPRGGVTSGSGTAPRSAASSAERMPSTPSVLAGVGGDGGSRHHPSVTGFDAFGDVITPYGAMAAALEEEYWNIVEGDDRGLFVQYGNDQDTREVGSGFPESMVAVPPPTVTPGEGDRGSGAAGGEGHAGGGGWDHCLPAVVTASLDDADFYRRTGWNLNNLPFLQPSVLRHVNEEINGVNVPWLYLGMLFSSFAWHSEDHYLFSINYMHLGQAKTWYGVPGLCLPSLETAMRAFHKGQGVSAESVALYDITTIMPPSYLKAAGVPVYRLLQEPGHFVITFPQAYHCGFSHGFNMAEACNFALPDWIPFGASAVETYRSGLTTRPLCFSHDQLMCSVARHCTDHPSEQCSWIVEGLRRVMETERREREAALRDSVGHSVHLTDESGPRYECSHCRNICYLSAIVCRCSMGDARRVACLRHASQVCMCPPANRILVFWYPIPVLQRLLDGVVARALVTQPATTKVGGDGARATGDTEVAI